MSKTLRDLTTLESEVPSPDSDLAVPFTLSGRQRSPHRSKKLTLLLGFAIVLALYLFARTPRLRPERNPANEILALTEHARAENQQAVLSFYAGELPAAQAQFESLLVREPSNPDLWTNLGISLRHQKNSAAAQIAFKKALDFDANHPAALNGLGQLASEANDPEQARVYFESALKSAAGRGVTRLNLGKISEIQGRWSDAAKQYRIALAEPDLDPTLRALVSKRLQKIGRGE